MRKELLSASLIIAGICGCATPGSKEEKDMLPVADSPVINNQKDTSVKITRKRFSEIFPFNWNEYKAHRTKMVSCAQPIEGTFKGDAEGFYFSYCLIGAHAQDVPPVKPTGEQLKVGAEYVVWFTGRKKTAVYYDSIHEKLVSIRCRLQDERLQGMNLLQHNKQKLDALLGAPDSASESNLFYLRENEFLKLRFTGEMLSSFQWFMLDTTAGSLRQVPSRLLKAEY